MNYTFYRIYSKNPSITECYIGSTEDFNDRKLNHKSYCNNTGNPHYNYKLYQYIRSNGGFDQFEFEIIDRIIFSEIDRLLHENKLMDLYGSSLNTRRAIIPKEELKEYRTEYDRRRYETHKEEINNKRRTKMVCEVCGGRYALGDISKHFKTKKHLKINPVLY
jgi:hypothetical protein